LFAEQSENRGADVAATRPRRGTAPAAAHMGRAERAATAVSAGAEGVVVLFLLVHERFLPVAIYR
jgi:hypothetical protein